MNQKAKLLLAVVAFLLLTPLTIYYVLDGTGVFDTRSRADVSTDLPEKFKIADLNADNKISIADFSIWLSNFRQFKNNPEAFNAMSDLNNDEAITISDFAIWLGLWREYKALYACRTTWWFDNESTACTMTERCGSEEYMYEGLREFDTESECITALANRDDDEPVVAGVDVGMVPGYGTGADGECLLAMGSVDVNTASCSGRATADAANFSLTTSVVKDATTVTLASAPAGLAVGDEILFINLQGTVSDYSNVGEYESVLIEGIEGNTITLKTPLKYGYDGTTQKIMVQRVPQYSDVNIKTGATLSPKAWDGIKGGVLIFKVKGNLVVDGKIHADGMGYRGGTVYEGGEAFGGYNSGGSGSKKGNMGGGGGGSAPNEHKSIAGGAGSETGGAGGAGGHGTTGSDGADKRRGGAGGGGGYGAGGQGGGGHERGIAGGINISGKGGYARGRSTSTGGGGGGGGAYGFSDLGRLYFGSGGGGGGKGASNTIGKGGAGGGIVYIISKDLEVKGSISSSGANGTNGGRQNSVPAGGSGGGGGGAGGSVKFLGSELSLGTGLVTASGGNGGSGRFTGGTGGVGRIAAYYTNTLTGVTAPVAYTKK